MARSVLLDSVHAVARSVDGTVLGRGDRPVTAVTIDSRSADSGSLFVALPGRHTDGHAFLADVLGAGAAALVRADVVAERRQELEGLLAEGAGSLCVVENPLRALQQLAAERLHRFDRLRRVAVTGSNGKTTTKEMIASVLLQKAATFKTRGNYNSEIGIPLSVFEVNETHRFGVFELGMNHVGEMETLAEIVRPEVAVVTNIGTAHIGLVGSREAIAREKSKIFSRFDGRQTAVIPEADRFRPVLEDGLAGSVVPFGEESTAGFEGASPRGLDGSVLRWRGREIRLPLPGRHNVRNALAAVTVGELLGCTEGQIAAGLESVRAEFGRGEVYHGRITLLQDAYNANVESMREAVRLVDETPTPMGRKILVLGAMYELGEHAAEHHGDVVDAVKASRADIAVFFGEEFEEAALAAGARRDALPGESVPVATTVTTAPAATAVSADDRPANGGENTPVLAWTADFETLRRLVCDTVRKGDLVLLKGSRGTRLERLVPCLREGEE
ncbi:MAG: UDP-N-acetylmuramoyl-tripeptide--D-alanyl-D-alanine ligase [Spirochaetaceae bacterium]